MWIQNSPHQLHLAEVELCSLTALCDKRSPLAITWLKIQKFLVVQTECTSWFHLNPLFPPFLGVLVVAWEGHSSPPEEITKIKLNLPQSALLELNEKGASQVVALLSRPVKETHKPAHSS